jgi:16S rRNA pseudouridine516 synthase
MRPSHSLCNPRLQAPMKLTKYLGNLGYGTRREVTQLLARKRVTGHDGVALWPDSAFQHHELRVDGELLDPALGVVVMLNKPVAYVCSTRDVPPLVYELLPPRFLRRTPVIAPIGRLDRDTTGLLLLTDDGELNHRLTSPKSRQPKTYRVQLANDLRGDEAEQFASGTLMLTSETAPLAPATLEVIAPRDVNITVTEGRYHQVRRMFAAVGNHVTALHRTAVGAQTLGDLASGSWRTLTADEIAELRN